MPDDAPGRPALPGRQREARANNTAILAAAREVFSAQGHGASVADVAQRAGVGVGSVYRRYPTKEALVEALHVSGVSDIADLAASIADAREQSTRDNEPGRDATAGASPGAHESAVAEFLARHIREAPGPLLRPPGAQSPIPPELAVASDCLRVALDRLVAIDRAAGCVPDGFAAADVMQLLVHLRPPLPYAREHADALHLRYLDLVVRGLREQARSGVSIDGGPAWDEWVGAWHD